jgi:cell division control protein 24
MSVSAVEMAAHGPGLSRMYTAPNLPTKTNSVNPYPNGMGHGPRASQLSGSTAFTSSSSTTLATTTSSPSSNGGPVLATDNIINQKADASKSLYQICVNLRQRLRQVPGFEQHLTDSDDEDDGEDVEMDPVSSLWRCLRKGYPLMTIYNCLQPPNPLQIAEGTVAARNIPKSAAFKFVQACLMELKFEECFVLTDLFGDDTTGFVKVSLVSVSSMEDALSNTTKWLIVSLRKDI